MKSVVCFLSLICCCLLAGPGLAEEGTVFGHWETYDDTSGELKSEVLIYQEEGTLYGKIVKLFRGPDEEPDPVCKECPGDLKNQKILGMQIIKGLQKKGSEWSGGTILDPDNGKTYDCKIWLENGKLKVRGYLLFFYRTQTWLRATE